MTFISVAISLLCLLLLSTVGSTESQCSVGPSELISVKHENVTLDFSSLQEALDYISVLNTSHSKISTVCLPQGHHRIVKQVQFNAANLVLLGTEGAVIVCDYNPLPFERGFDYTWQYNESRLVQFEKIIFMNCPYPFRLIAVQNVTIRDCSFSNFSEAVLDLFNCETIRLEQSFFHNNSGTGILFETFRGNTGAVAIGYSNFPSFLSQPRAYVNECEFVDNSALASSEFLTSERAVSNRVFTGRGGGLGIFIDESDQNVTFEMANCKFMRNYARSYGGGIYIILNGYGTQHILNFNKIELISNRGQLGGAGVQLSYLSATNTYVPPHTVMFSQCNFENNVGDAGAGMYIFTSFIGALGMYFKLEGCTFIGNRGSGSINEFGAAVGVSLFTIFEQRVTAERHDIINCTFSGNIGRNGIVSTGYSPIRFSGTNLFRNNSGASIRIVGSLVDFFDKVVFVNNTGMIEGALSLLSLGQMRMNRGLQASFDGNRGRLGASITVTSPDTLSALSSILYNPACFAIYEDPLVAPTEWDDVSVSFQANTAVLGSALYLSRVGQCAWFSQSPPFFQQKFLREWPIWKFSNNTNTGYPDSHNPDYYVGTHAKEIAVNVDKVSSWPGENFQMAITGINEFNQITSTSARLFQVYNNTLSVNLSPEIVVIAGSSESGLLRDEFSVIYSVTSKSTFREVIDESFLTIGIEEPFESLLILAPNFTLSTEACPGGYQLSTTTSSTAAQGGFTCQCVDIPEIVGCEEDSVIIKDGLWAGFVSTQTPNLFFHSCPPGYCQCTLNSSLGPERCVYKYTHSNKDLQCNNQREGLLCGSCKNSSGVSVLLDKCVSCSNGYIALLVALILCDILAFVVITLIDGPVPQWVYPFIFYVQMAPFISSNFPESFETIGVYMTYANSALGFYFIYDFCLLNSLPPLASYFIRYLPFILALVVCTSIRIIGKYYLRRKSLKQHGYWLITLLLYPHLVRSSLSILNCPQIPDTDGSYAFRWIVDGDVQCFTRWHIPLALFAIVVLSACFASIAIVTFLSIKKPEFIKKYIPPLTVAYRQQCQFWAGIDLGRRLLLLILITSSPRNTVYTTLFLVIILAMYSYLLPYKSRVANAVEVTLLLNMLVLMLLEATPLIKESLFTFDAVIIVSPISWLLFIFYYLPAMLLAGVIIGLASYKLWRYYKNKARKRVKIVTVSNVPSTVENANVTTQSVSLSSSLESSL